jgi:hypothetical protein
VRPFARGHAGDERACSFGAGIAALPAVKPDTVRACSKPTSAATSQRNVRAATNGSRMSLRRRVTSVCARAAENAVMTCREEPLPAEPANGLGATA